MLVPEDFPRNFADRRIFLCSWVTNICLKGSGMSLIVCWQFLWYLNTFEVYTCKMFQIIIRGALSDDCKFLMFCFYLAKNGIKKADFESELVYMSPVTTTIAVDGKQ